MIHLENIHKTYRGGQPLHVLKGIDLDIERGEFVSIMGASGSGKSTLLNILGILDNYDEGLYTLNGVPVKDLSESKAADYRNRMIGFIFQSFNLIGYKTALENVALPLYYQGVSRKERNRRAMEHLERLGLDKWDEPTGALDSKTSGEVMQLLTDLNAEGRTVVVVTHESGVAYRTKKIVHIQDGLIGRIEINDPNQTMPFGELMK